MDIISYLLGKKAGGGGGTVNLESKEVTITSNTTTEVTPSEGYDGLSKVNITTNVPSGMDWSLIGYTPEDVQADYDYSLSIKNNWVDSQNLSSKFLNNTTLKYMPVVSTTNASGSIESMFKGCSNLLEIPPFVFTNEITSIYQMFRLCSKLKKIDASNWNGTNLKNISQAFYNCTDLEYLDLRTIDFSKVTNFSSAFSSVPTNCLIIVKDQTAKDWFTTNFSTLTNVQTVEEYELR